MSSTNKRVLIVDPAPRWLRVAADRLPEGAEPLLAEDFESALDHLANRRVDLVVVELLGVDSALGDALQTIAHIRRRWRIPIILFTDAYRGVAVVDREQIALTADVSAVCLKDGRGPEDDLTAWICRLLGLEWDGRAARESEDANSRDAVPRARVGYAARHGTGPRLAPTGAIGCPSPGSRGPTATTSEPRPRRAYCGSCGRRLPLGW